MARLAVPAPAGRADGPANYLQKAGGTGGAELLQKVSRAVPRVAGERRPPASPSPCAAGETGAECDNSIVSFVGERRMPCQQIIENISIKFRIEDPAPGTELAPLWVRFASTPQRDPMRKPMTAPFAWIATLSAAIATLTGAAAAEAAGVPIAAVTAA